MKALLNEDMTMDDIMRLWPSTIRVVLDHSMLCVGCPIAPFHTVSDAVREHHLDGVRFRLELEDAIKATAIAS